MEITNKIKGKKIFHHDNIEIIINTGIYYVSLYQIKLIFDAIRETFRATGYPYKTQVSISFVLPSEIKHINKEYRGKDSVTDVLSFPIDYYGGLLGDVVICVKRLVLQAEEFGNTVDREFSYLIVHSILHLLGFDHMSLRDKKTMRHYEKMIMANLDVK